MGLVHSHECRSAPAPAHLAPPSFFTPSYFASLNRFCEPFNRISGGNEFVADKA